MRLARPLVAAALAAGSLLLAPSANAACVGTQSTAYVCVTPPTLTQQHLTECVYAGGDTCENVTVPYYGIGDEGDVSCGGSLAACTLVNNIDELFRPCGPLVACP